MCYTILYFTQKGKSIVTINVYSNISDDQITEVMLAGRRVEITLTNRMCIIGGTHDVAYLIDSCGTIVSASMNEITDKLDVKVVTYHDFIRLSTPPIKKVKNANEH